MPKKPRIRYWLLKDTLSKKYFKEWTGIGPAATSSRVEAERFPNKNSAMRSPAYSFALTFYEPVAVR